jgi:hypothetical protein
VEAQIRSLENRKHPAALDAAAEAVERLGTGASVWKMNEISRHKSSDVLAGYIREAELFQQHASVGMYWTGEMAGVLWL